MPGKVWLKFRGRFRKEAFSLSGVFSDPILEFGSRSSEARNSGHLIRIGPCIWDGASENPPQHIVSR